MSIELTHIKEKKCKHCGSMLEEVYKIPKKGGHRVK